jgi:hypothetical protein
MRDNVKQFIRLIWNDADIKQAAEETGIVDMPINDFVNEFSLLAGGKINRHKVEALMMQMFTKQFRDIEDLVM